MVGAIGGMGGIGVMGGMGGIGAMGGMASAPAAGAAADAGTDAPATGISVGAPSPGISVTISDTAKAALAADNQLAVPMNSAAPTTGISGPSASMTINLDVNSLDSNAAGQGLLGMGNLDILVAVLLLALLNQQNQGNA